MAISGTKRGLLQLMSLSVLAYPLAFIVQMLLSNYFGTSAAMDSYWLAMAVIGTMGFYVGPAREAAIPEFYKRLRDNAARGVDYISGIGNTILLITLAAVLIACLAPQWLTTFVAGSKQPADRQMVATFILWLTPLIVLTCATEVLNGILVSYGRVIFQEIGRLLKSGVSIICLVLFAAAFGVKALIISVVGAQAVLFIVQCVELYLLGFRYQLLHRPAVDAKFIQMSGALLISYAVGQVYVIFERTTFTHFGEGVLSSFQYARSVSGIPDQVLTASLTTAIWPSILRHTYDNNHEKVFSSTMRACRYLTLILGGIALVCLLFPREIIYFVFFRGAFNMQSLAVTALALKILAVALCPLGAGAIIGRVLVSQQRSKSMMLIGIANALAGMAALFIGRLMGNVELAMSHVFCAAAAAFAATMISLLKAVKIKPTPVQITAFFAFIFKLAAISFLIFRFYPAAPFIPAGKWEAARHLFIGASSVLAIFSAACLASGLLEMSLLQACARQVREWLKLA